MLRMPGSACCAPPAWPGALSLTFAMRLAAPPLTATLVTRPDPYQTSALDVADCGRYSPRNLATISSRSAPRNHAIGSQRGSQDDGNDRAASGEESVTWRARRDSNPQPSDP